MGISIPLNQVNRMHVLPDQLPEDAIAFSVKYSQITGIYHDGLIDEINHNLHGFIGSFATQVDIGTKLNPPGTQVPITQVYL